MVRASQTGQIPALAPASKSGTAKFEAWEGGIKVTTDGVSADGKPTHTECAAKYDGKDYP